ncbi:hypothetical protein R5R35_009558 [Gryllus longicercus]|uniref:PNPLA domain-containing protein n=2 Tax=Gryllus longicercus TaxID=2509291 RepID=A0AAN9VNR8_9ORTH
MSLSKAIRQYDRCMCTTRRFYNAQSASPENSSNESLKMSLSSQLRVMSVNQWKLLSQLKDYISKTSNEKISLNKEWISLLHKISSITGQAEEAIRKGLDNASVTKIESDEVTSPTTQTADTSNKQNQTTFPQVLNGLKLKMSPKASVETTDDLTPKWKSKKDVVSLTSIGSRTRHVISSVASAESTSSRLKRLESLANHLHQYPESRYLAVKEGAIRLLLRLRQETKDEETLAALREGLTILGYVDPLPGHGIRILSIDGGGIRGLLVIEMLKKLEKLTGKRLYELFDFICGVSTGAIMIGVIAAQKKPLDEASFLYKEMSKKIFNQSAFWGTSSLVWSHSYYSTDMWEELLKKYVGEIEMIKTARDPLIPKIAAVSAVVNQERVMSFVFRNYSLPYKVQSQYMGSNQYKMWEAARASAAAPSYFEEFRLGDYLHQDGGILTNNPCAVAIHESKHLWPGAPLQCVVSLGTGRCHPSAQPPVDQKASSASSWKTKFMKILDSATDTEAVHTILNDLLPENVYFRFNPYVTEMVTMDEIRPEKISQLEMDAEMYYRRNEEIFQEIATALTQPATRMQQFQNWINLQRELLGFK